MHIVVENGSVRSCYERVKSLRVEADITMCTRTTTAVVVATTPARSSASQPRVCAKSYCDRDRIYFYAPATPTRHQRGAVRHSCCALGNLCSFELLKLHTRSTYFRSIVGVDDPPPNRIDHGSLGGPEDLGSREQHHHCRSDLQCPLQAPLSSRLPSAAECASVEVEPKLLYTRSNLRSGVVEDDHACCKRW